MNKDMEGREDETMRRVWQTIKGLINRDIDSYTLREQNEVNVWQTMANYVTMLEQHLHVQVFEQQAFERRPCLHSYVYTYIYIYIYMYTCIASAWDK